MKSELIYIIWLVVSLCQVLCASGNSEGTPDLTPFVIGGNPVNTSTEYPFMVAVGVLESDNIGGFCGGTIVNEIYVLTAAQCTHKVNFTKVIILAGTNIAPHNQTKDSIAVYPVLKKTEHPGFRQLHNGTYENDIAVIELVRRFFFVVSRPNFKPVQLATQNQSEGSMGRAATALGFGLDLNFTIPLHPVPVLPSELQQAEFDVVNMSFCQKQYDNISLSEERQICLFGTNNHTACSFDVGGPILIKDDNGTQIQLGIISMVPERCMFGNDTTNTSHVVGTRVSAYAEWIKQTTKNAAPQFSLNSALVLISFVLFYTKL